MFKKSLVLVSLFSVQVSSCAQEISVRGVAQEQQKSGKDTKYDSLDKYCDDVSKIAYRKNIQLAGFGLGVVITQLASGQGYIDNVLWNYFAGAMIGDLGSSLIAMKIAPYKSKEGKESDKRIQKVYATGLSALALTTAAMKYASKAGYIKESFWKYLLAYGITQALFEKLVVDTPQCWHCSYAQENTKVVAAADATAAQ